MEKVLNTTKSNWYDVLTEFGYDRVECKILDKKDDLYYTIEYFDVVTGKTITDTVLAKFVY